MKKEKQGKTTYVPEDAGRGVSRRTVFLGGRPPKTFCLRVYNNPFGGKSFVSVVLFLSRPCQLYRVENSELERRFSFSRPRDIFALFAD